MDKQIATLFAAYDHAWNERDTESYCNLFLEDATAIFFLLDGNKTELNGRQGLYDIDLEESFMNTMNELEKHLVGN